MKKHVLFGDQLIGLISVEKRMCNPAMVAGKYKPANYIQNGYKANHSDDPVIFRNCSPLLFQKGFIHTLQK
jgi:hypothetical protein